MKNPISLHAFVQFWSLLFAGISVAITFAMVLQTSFGVHLPDRDDLRQFQLVRLVEMLADQMDRR